MKNLTKLARAAGLQKFELELPDYWVADMQKQFGVDPRGGKLNDEVVWIVWSFDEYVALGEPFPLSPGAEKLLVLWETQKAANAAIYRQNLASGKRLEKRLEHEEFERLFPSFFEKKIYEEDAEREVHEEDTKE